MKQLALVFVVLVVISVAFRFWQREPSLPVAALQPHILAVSFEHSVTGDFASKLREIIARADSQVDKAAFGKTTFFYDACINAPPLLPNPS